MTGKIIPVGNIDSDTTQQPCSNASVVTTTKASTVLGGAISGTGGSLEEAFLGLLGGMAYGMVSPVVGHPFDTVKTKMQGDAKYKHMHRVSSVVTDMWKTGGVRNFYRGFIPPLLGSCAFRGVLFSAYSGTYAACQHVPVLSEPIPHTGGLRLSVLCGGLAAAIARSSIESPFEFIKVRMQTGAGWHHGEMTVKSLFSFRQLQHVYQGYVPTFFRTWLLLGSFFTMVDYSVRYIPEVINAPLLGPFFKGGICATISWGFAFPFETVKSVVQADMKGTYKSMGTRKVLMHLYRTRGIRRGWYRGFGPGASRSFFANGASMLVYTWFQETTRS